ncbi:MAG: imidazole glycerol phosphate synthase subunit HisH [Sphingomonadaceae bacterium]|nr:imidazole glycerol phosphate synthase subunit HisH [Sphingomonadaceae bacterium]
MSAAVALIDYGAGNLQSVANALKETKYEHVAVTADADIVVNAERIILPGVGAFAHCMGALGAIPGMIEAMEIAVLERGAPFLGICVGMQLMAGEGCEHGVTPGLGWIAGSVAAIAPAPGIKVPHMGWNHVDVSGLHPVLKAGEAYFLHGYAFAADDPEQVLALTDHGGPIVAAVGRDNMIGVQFHPEKSQAYGLATLERFLAWRP